MDKSRLNSTRYTVLFATVVCVVCAALVSVAAVTLQPRQKANARLYMEKNVLVAAGLVEPGASVGRQQVERFFERDIRARVVDFATGELLPADRIDARNYDQRAARNDPGASRVAPPNNAGIGRIPNYGVVYFVLKEGRVEQLVIAVEGLGMWGTIYGFLSLAADANTVRGLTYYDHKETPGLGGEIGNPAWQALWEGRKGYDRNWRAGITVIKGQAGPPETDPLRVDGLSGATVTSNAITRLMQFWLSDDGYGKFLRRFREGAIEGVTR
ncbi:Na(+)-translocating NADH-quinone reductase subunit C [Betaproteobacteria bacterium PRO7]|jgi:Na+-transporting NADH:ubiquinone oxidoreductase subunit C|nr:Na(+)-translocating NADH-quinone reductase subunit C [Betaproteobacteria bacterium PRO7]